ncbi:hypothetical protein ACJIZ3_019248 [Penstemon smallii]|uniref:Uncharacterized protein n=1 Tax=Penstemon smallii TaxID=265156 RepID=A0ABD3T1C3_9LAMI
MKERESSLSDEKDHHRSLSNPKNEPINSPSNNQNEIQSLSNNNNNSLKENSPTKEDDDHELPVSSQPLFNSRTYVVQVPKDQIYRTPPPEHVLMINERRHHNRNQQKKSCGCCSYPSCLLVLFKRNKLAKESRVKTEEHHSSD